MIIERLTEATQDSMVLESKAINQERVTQTITLGSTSLTIHNKINLSIIMVIYSLNSTNKSSLSKKHIEIIKQILNNNHLNKSSNIDNKALGFMHHPETTLLNRDNQNLTIFSNNQSE